MLEMIAVMFVEVALALPWLLQWIGEDVQLLVGKPAVQSQTSTHRTICVWEPNEIMMEGGACTCATVINKNVNTNQKKSKQKKSKIILISITKKLRKHLYTKRILGMMISQPSACACVCVRVCVTVVTFAAELTEKRNSCEL